MLYKSNTVKDKKRFLYAIKKSQIVFLRFEVPQNNVNTGDIAFQSVVKQSKPSNILKHCTFRHYIHHFIQVTMPDTASLLKNPLNTQRLHIQAIFFIGN